MSYSRTFNQADWFFNPGKTPGGLEPTGAAAPPLPGSPGSEPASPVAPPPMPPAAGPSAEEETAEEGAKESNPAEASSAPPVLEKKKGPPLGLYLLGGIAVAVIGFILYKKFGGEDEEETAPAALEATSEAEVSKTRRRNKKK